VLRLLPFVLIPGAAGALAYWLTRSRVAAVLTGAAVLAAMLFIGITG
jgi:hypothetical protein